MWYYVKEQSEQKIPQSQIFDINAKKAKDTLAIVQADNNIKLALLELILVVEPTDIDGFDIADITPPNAETIDVVTLSCCNDNSKTTIIVENSNSNGNQGDKNNGHGSGNKGNGNGNGTNNKK